MSRKKPVPPREELQAAYEQVGATLSSLEKVYNAPHQRIRKWIIDYGIPLKGHLQSSQEANSRDSIDIPPYEVLYDLYITQKKSLGTISKTYRVKSIAVSAWLKTYNIPQRTLSEATTFAKAEQFAHIQFSKEEIEPVYEKYKNISLLADHFSVSYSHAKTLLKQYGIKTYQPNASVGEHNLFLYCESIHPEGDWHQRDRSIIQPYELDIVCTDLKLAIEYCGLYWHSEHNAGKDRGYHRLKQEWCKEKGYSLLTIFECDDIEKVKGILRHKIGKDTIRIGARKTTVRTISSSEASKFHNSYHINGYVNSTVNYGLFYNNDLLQVVSFSKSRFNKNFEWECTRSSSKFGYSVGGGVSKLFAHFIEEHNVKSLITYADLRFGEGKVYENCGMKLVRTSTPNYWYFRDETKVHSRVQFQKHKLPEKLMEFDEKLTEWENMKLNGYDRIWDCGNNVYVL